MSVRQFQDDSRATADEALAESESRQRSLEAAWVAAKLERGKLRTVLRNLPVAVWVADPDGAVIGANDEAERIQGFAAVENGEPAEARRLGPEHCLSFPDGTPCTPERMPIARALAGETVTREEFLWPHRSGLRAISVTAAPLADAQGANAGAVMVAVDVTAQKRTEAALAEAEAQFRVIAEKSPVMIWRADQTGRCDYVNQTWCEFRGLGPGHHLGEGWADGLHPDDRDRVLADLRHALARRAPFEISFRLKRHDGVFRWVNDRGTPFHDAEGRFLGFLGSCLDITPRVELEDALDRQRVIAEEASLHKTQLVSALSHDVRTPLNAVVLAAQLMEAHLGGDLDAEVQECLRTIRHSVRNVLDLLGDLLDLSKLEAGATPPVASRFPLEPVLAECLSSIEPQARQKGLAVQYDPDGLAGVASRPTGRSSSRCSPTSSPTPSATPSAATSGSSANTVKTRSRSASRTPGSGSTRPTSRGFSRSSPFWTAPAAHSARGPGWAWRSAGGWPCCSAAPSRSTASPGVGSTFRLVLPASVVTRSAPAAVAAPGAGAVKTARAGSTAPGPS